MFCRDMKGPVFFLSGFHWFCLGQKGEGSLLGEAASEGQ